MSHENRNEVFDSIRRGNTERLEQLVTSEHAANTPDHWGQHPLVLAASLGRIDAVAWLLDRGADIDTTSAPYQSDEPPSDRMSYLLSQEGADRDIEEDLSEKYESALGALAQIEMTVPEIVANVMDSPLRPETENESALAAACRNRHESVVTLLLARGASTEARHWSQTPPLVHAAEQGCPAIVRQLLSAGACPDTQFDVSPLMVASMEGKTPIVKQLISAGADPDLPDEEGYTPLMAASASGILEAVRCLVYAGADCDATAAGIDPLVCAADAGHHAVYEFLVSRCSSETRSSSEENRMNPVPIESLSSQHAARQAARIRQSDFLTSAMVGDLLGVREGIKNHVSIDTIGTEGYSGLMCAASNGHVEIVEWLIENGATVDLRATNGSADAHVSLSGILGRDSGATALGLVSGTCYCPNRPKMIRELVRAGADLDSADAAGLSPLLRAVSQGMTDSCQALIELGADVNACDHESNSAIMLAHVCGNERITSLLRAAGATDDGLENVLLCDAVEACKFDEVWSLLHGGANVNHRGDTTPLVIAVGTRNPEMVELLLESGADPNRAAEPGGFTPIARAAYGGDSAIVRVLLDAGADPLVPVLTAYDAVQYARLGAAEGRGNADCYDEIETLLQRKVG